MSEIIAYLILDALAIRFLWIVLKQYAEVI